MVEGLHVAEQEEADGDLKRHGVVCSNEDDEGKQH
jgi:hypothetical protein